jgi:hypothetical protein
MIKVIVSVIMVLMKKEGGQDSVCDGSNSSSIFLKTNVTIIISDDRKRVVVI